ncbi:PIG-L family deacetylase [Streptomyces tricolor]|nr:PIG-L family deacetylase [Streptomyces tricolor]
MPTSLLGVFAHPDDEALLAGGVLARHAAAGGRTAVVTATWAPGTPRAGELADAVAALGVREPRGCSAMPTTASRPPLPAGHGGARCPLDEAVGRPRGPHQGGPARDRRHP